MDWITKCVKASREDSRHEINMEALKSHFMPIEHFIEGWSTNQDISARISKLTIDLAWTLSISSVYLER